MSSEFDLAGLAASAREFWTPDSEVIIVGLLLWLLLRRTLKPDSRPILRHAGIFMVICLLLQMAATLAWLLDMTAVADGLREAALVGFGAAMIRLLGLLVFRAGLHAVGVEVARIVEDIAVTLGYVIWAMVRLRYAGVELSHLVTTSAMITAVLAFAMQDTLGNILGGLAIHLDHSVEIGDWVVVDNVAGRVVDITWRHTKIATRNGEKVVVPNSVLMKTKFLVIGTYGGAAKAWRRILQLNVPLEHTPERVQAAVMAMFSEAEIANVAREPAPSCVLLDFGPGYGRYAVRYWLTDPAADDPTDSAVRIHVLAALKRAGMALALPTETRHIVDEDGALEQDRNAIELRHRQAVLGQVELLRHLTEEEIAQLAANLSFSPFSRGDIITRQGNAGDWLYIIDQGEVDVFAELDGKRRYLSTLAAGSIFGEMGLLTGAIRQATVVAKGPVDCYRLDKQGIENILHGRPEIAEHMARILADRTAELGRAREDLDSEARARVTSDGGASILERMRGYFRL